MGIKKPSNELYILLNEDNSLYLDDNREYKVYKREKSLLDNIGKHNTNRYGVFCLKNIKRQME